MEPPTATDGCEIYSKIPASALVKKVDTELSQSKKRKRLQYELPGASPSKQYIKKFVADLLPTTTQVYSDPCPAAVISYRNNHQYSNRCTARLFYSSLL
jgi:hypothetical protein